MKRLALIALAACGGTDEPPLSNVTALSCPSPGDLPFRVSHSFRHSTNASLAKMDTRVKHSGADTIGAPGGANANILLSDTAFPGTAAPEWDGTMGVTTETGGLFSQPMQDEYVSVWTYDGSAWQMLGKDLTDEDGLYNVAGDSVPNGQPAYAVLEANGTCADQFDYMFPAGEKVVISDIDGTLTTNDTELTMEIADPAYVPAMMGHADQLLQTWAMKGYPIVYLTNRPHVLRVETRTWLDMLAFPPGPVITSNGENGAAVYKTTWLRRMFDSFGWVPVAAYGNADTDIQAYATAGIPTSETFIVGPLAGSGGTQPIDNMDYAQHIQTYVAAQPDNN
jgi:hypothetical protein